VNWGYYQSRPSNGKGGTAYIGSTLVEADSRISRAVDHGCLELHPTKTKIVDERHDDDGFDFPGYTSKQGERWVRENRMHGSEGGEVTPRPLYISQ